MRLDVNFSETQSIMDIDFGEIHEASMSDEAIEKAVKEYLAENPVKMFETDETLTLDPDTNILTVNRAHEVEEDNTLPITSAAVFVEVGNINTLLKTI